MRLTLIFLACLLGSTALAKQPVRNISDLYGGQSAMALLRDYDSIRACLLEPVSGDWNFPPSKYEGYRIRGIAALKPAEMKLVAALLQDEKTYDWPDQLQPDGTNVTKDPGCRPFYHVRLELSRGADVLAVNFCFFCPGVLVARNDKEIQGALLGPRSSELLQLFAKLFPRDQLLKTALARQKKS
jgi:hypothetical protein